MIDWDRIKELRAEIGEDDFGEVVEIFLEEVEEGIGRLKSDRVDGTLAANLHFLKGSALNLGFHSFSTLCQAGETAASEGKEDEVDLSGLIACYQDSKKAFEQGLSA
ncbi:MAG: Hpt domain-containing protein [Rhodobacteraceae bacterium]|nr:Hpt domain-containing protein [Paracoccaceae bacterium]